MPEHDNAIVSDSFFLKNYDAPVWQRHVRNYLGGVADLLRQAIVDHRGVHEEPAFNLQEAETYFEFTHPNPVAAIAGLQEAIVAHRARVGVTVYPSGMVENSVEDNARCITVRRSSAVTLKLYAKTTKRIRIEVVHDLMKDAAALGGRHTTNSLDTFHTWFELLAEDAARLANELLSDLRSGLPVASGQASAADLLTAVSLACSRTEDVPTVMEMLCVNRRLAIGSHDPLAPVKDRLLSSGIVEARPRNTRDTVYTLARGYADAASALRSALFPDTVPARPSEELSEQEARTASQ